MKKLLITGASGFLGWNICLAARDKWDVFGIYNNNQIEIDKVKTIRLDISEKTLLEVIFYDIRPDAVIHCAAVSDPNKCQINPQISYLINVVSAQNIAALCEKEKIPFVFISTDLVFNGELPPYKEESIVSPINIYGKHKAEAEKSIQEIYPQSLICRMPLMFGDVPQNTRSFLQPILKAVLEKKEIKLFTDEYRTPISGKYAAYGILMAIEKCFGILHLGGRERISRYDFGILVTKILDKDASNIIPVSQKDLVMPAPRPKDVSLDSSKALSLGFKLPSLKEQILELNCVKEIINNYLKK